MRHLYFFFYINLFFNIHICINFFIWKDGIKQIFCQYGDVTSILSPSSADWAFVTYRTQREAVLAIGGLDRKPPLNLIVEFSRGRQTKNVKDYRRENGLALDSDRAPNPYAPDHRESSVYM